jgi:mitochondrial fission protein ELM1
MSDKALSKIFVVSDGTDSITQSYQLALRLTSPENITKIYKDDTTSSPYLELAIGVGFNVTEQLVNIKQQSGGKTKIAIILDPLAHYDKFDFIILPSYEPYKVTGNVLRTTGLINFVNDEYLAAQKAEFQTHPKYEFLRKANLKPPFLTVVIGGRHTGGNIDVEDTKIIADKINQLVSSSNGTALITTSKRTELAVSETLKQNLKVPYFLYDYKLRETENPYGVFLALADEIIVTGESVRMMSECCSTGKPVRIYRPRKYGFQYAPLGDEFINAGHAFEFNSAPPLPRAQKLDEAVRIAAIISKSL